MTVIKGPGDSVVNTHAPNIGVQALQTQFDKRYQESYDEDDPEMPPVQILCPELRAAPAEVLAEIPDRPNLRRHMTRVRLQNLLANPIRMSDLEEIPNQYTRTLDGSKLLLYDSFDDEGHDQYSGRILIFATVQRSSSNKESIRFVP